jgi:hypothetical protein
MALDRYEVTFQKLKKQINKLYCQRRERKRPTKTPKKYKFLYSKQVHKIALLLDKGPKENT